MQQYQPRFSGYQLPPQVQDRKERPQDEAMARIMRLLAGAAPVAGAGIGAIAGGLMAGPGGGMAGAGAGASLGAGLGQVASGFGNLAATETQAPNTERDLARDERMARIYAMLGMRGR